MRIELFDITKGILMILVILGHGMQYLYGDDYSAGGAFFNEPLYKCIYSFHMPLFMMISGYFYFVSLSKGFRYVLKSRVSSILIPYATYFVIYLFLSYVLKIVYWGGWFSAIVNVFWFLPSLFLNCIIVMICRGIIKKSNISNVVLLCVCILLLFVKSYLPATYIFMLYCFITGYYIRFITIKHEININKLKNTSSLVFSIMILLFCFASFNYETFIYTSGTCIFKEGYIDYNMVIIDIKRYLIGILGSLSFMYLIWYKRKTLNRIVVRYLVRISEYSIGMYCISNIYYLIYSHFISFKFDNDLQFVGYQHYLYVFILSFAIIIISFLTIMLINKSKKLNILFLGLRR